MIMISHALSKRLSPQTLIPTAHIRTLTSSLLITRRNGPFLLMKTLSINLPVEGSLCEDFSTSRIPK